MKKLLAIFTLFLLTSCQIEYEGAAKYVVKTKVIDKDGNPVADVPVNVVVSLGNLSDEITFGKTDQNGEVVLMFPPPVSDKAVFSISYDQNYSSFEPAIYFGKTIYNLKHSDFRNYLFNTGIIILYKNAELTQLKITKVQTSENTQITSLSTTAIIAESDLNLDSPEEIWFPYYFTVLKNQTFLINYTVTNYAVSPATTTEFSEEVSVGTTPLDYTITY